MRTLDKLSCYYFFIDTWDWDCLFSHLLGLFYRLYPNIHLQLILWSVDKKRFIQSIIEEKVMS